jgi:uncharacterized protein (TIGR02594 family)
MTGVEEVPWLIEARHWIGLKEIKGPQHEPEILRLRSDAGTGIRNDDDAWCSDFVGGCMKRSLVEPTRSAAARSWLHWGIDVKEPRLEDIPPGAVLVFERPPNPWQGHVGFAVGYTSDGFLKLLGGNQRDSVSIADKSVSLLIGARWPVEFKDDVRMLKKLPLLSRSGVPSANEA